ncbi:MAG: tetratricopeptide repeat protein [Candidatus Eremiobacterota bacterium]
MSQDRFRWLEFDESAPAPAPTASDKDEHYYLQEAVRAYLEGDFEPALRHYSAALKHDKALHEAWAGQVRCLVRMKELREAQTWSDKACKLFPGTPVLESARALAQAASGLMAEALAASDRALEAAEKSGLPSPHLWLERGACLVADKQISTAEHCFAKVLEHCPDDPDWAQRIASEWLEGEQPARAAQLLNEVVQKRPARAYVWLLQARALRRLGQKKRALEALDRADSLRQNWPEAIEERRLLSRNCWIATLVFGSENHPSVASLRQWRDERWLTCAVGRLGSDLYDRTAPGVCLLVSRSPRTRRLLRGWLQWLAARLEDGRRG